MPISSLPGANPCLSEYKIGVFVRFWGQNPPFSVLSSTKSGFLCAFASKFFPIMFFMGSLSAASSRWLFAAAPLPVAAMPRRSLQQHLCHGAPASYKPHPAEKSTTVRLAIWRNWAGFANSQLRRANFSALTYIYASIPIAATLKPLLRHTQICRPICTDCLRHLRISTG